VWCQELRSDLEAMLLKAPELIEGMIEICNQRKWLSTTLATIKFAQCVVQGLWYTNHPLMQVPHFTEEMAQAVAKDSTEPSKTLIEYLRLSDKEKTGLSKLTDAQKKDVYEACRIIPCLKIVTTLFVEEEETDFYEGEDDAPAPTPAPDAPKGDHIFEQDLVTLRVNMTRENVPEGSKKKKASAPPVHAPMFPKTIRESWWLILTDKVDTRKGALAEVTIHAIEKISDQSRVINHELRFMAPQRAGGYEMELHVYSDCYMGLDETIPITFTVSPAAELPEYEPHPEDVELDNEPTLFEQVMAANVDDSSDDEDDEDAKEKSEEVAGAVEGEGEEESEEED
jgi:translocation protein SEC63